jgi:hypothetical protein
MRKGKIHFEKPPKGLMELHENGDPVRIKIDRKFYTQLERTAENLEQRRTYSSATSSSKS